MDNEEKPRAIKLKNRCEDYVHLVSRRGCAAETTPDDKGVITMNLSGINAVKNIIDNCTDNYNISIRNKLYEIDDILDEFEFTSFGIGGEINESQRSIKEQNNNLSDFRESVSIYNHEVIEMENNTADKLKMIAGIGEGKEGSESQIGDNAPVEFIPTFSLSAQYIPGQIVKIKGTDGKWYIGTAQVNELVGTGGYRKFKFVPNKLNDVDVSQKENVVEYLKSLGNGIIAGIEHYSTGCRNALDYIGENWLWLDYDRPCIDNPNVTMRDQMNKANDDDARDYNSLRNNSQYKSVFDNTSRNAEKTLNTIDAVLAVHGIKNIAVGSAIYLRANKPYIHANIETVKNNANILNEAVSNVNKRPRGMVLGSNGGNIDSYIRDVNKEYKELKNVESVVNNGGSKTVKPLLPNKEPYEFMNDTTEHIFTGVVKNTGTSSEYASGWHYMGNNGVNGNEIVTITKGPDKFGTIEAKVKINGVNKEGVSTLFSDKYTPNEVNDMIMQAHMNKKLVPGSRGLYRGVADNGMTIEMYLYRNSEGCNIPDIITAYPVHSDVLK